MCQRNLRLLNKFRRLIVSIACYSTKPTSSEVLTTYLVQCKEPPWTSYFVKYSSVKDDQFGMSNFNWKVGKSNYQILRTGCFPYIKYHCSKKEAEDLKSSDTFMRVIKITNLVNLDCKKFEDMFLINLQRIVYSAYTEYQIFCMLPGRIAEYYAKVFGREGSIVFYSEHLFSEAGIVYDKKIRKLLPENAEKLVLNVSFAP